MSEQVHYKGKIRPVERLYHESLEEQCQRIMNEKGYESLDDYYDSWEEAIAYRYYEEYVIIDEELYIVELKEDVDDIDVYNIHKNKDGSFDYEVSYYNGGCCFEEALQEAMDRMNEEAKGE